MELKRIVMLEKIKLQNEPFFICSLIKKGGLIQNGELTGNYYILGDLNLLYLVVSCIDTNEIFLIKK